jgi:SnoaL-like domain
MDPLSEEERPMLDCLRRYIKGWEDDDLDMLLGACADDFIYDDPYDGRMTKAEFADYYRELPDVDGGFSEEMVQEAGDGATHWSWWASKPEGAAEWTQEGSALTKADADGVHSCKIAYYKGSGSLA